MKIFVLFLGMLFISTSYSQSSLQKFTGEYAGTLYLEFPDKLKDSLHCIFELQASDVSEEFIFKFNFESDQYGKTVKDYRLKPNKKFDNQSHFLLDELNGIEMHMILIGNSLYAQYSVMKGSYSTRLTFDDSGVYYEIICGKMVDPLTTSSRPEEGQEKYLVESWLPFTVQHGYLKRNSP